MIDRAYKIILKYYQADVLESTYETQRIIDNEDSLEFAFGRKEMEEGVFLEASDTFIFIKEDRDYVIAKRADYLSRKDRGTYLQLEFYAQDDLTTIYELEYTGKLKFQETEIPDYYIECQFDEDSIVNTIDTIKDTKVTIEKEGIAYTYDISLSAIYDAARVFQYQGEAFFLTDNGGGGYSGTSETGAIFRKEETELSDTYYNSFLRVYPVERTTGIYIERINALISAPLLSSGGTYSFTVTSVVDYGDGGGDVTTTILSESGTISAGSTKEKVLDAITIAVDSGRIVYNSDAPFDGTVVSVSITSTFVDDNSTIGLNVNSYIGGGDLDTIKVYTKFDNEFKTSQIVGHPSREILDDYEALQGITINTDALDGTIYDVNNMLITTSRGVKGIIPLTYNFSFDDWFKSMKSFCSLSINYVGDVIYILPIGEAYDDSETYALPNALNATISTNDKTFDKLTIGNSGGGSSNFDYGDLDFNAPATYELGLQDGTSVDLTNKIRVDGSTINKAAIDSDKIEISIEDRDEDKDLYFIARDPLEPKIQSQFTHVSGVDFQKFGPSINMEFSRSRQLYNWRRYYGHLFTGFSGFQLKSWDKNKDLIYTDTDRGIEVVDTPDDFGVIESNRVGLNVTSSFGSSGYRGVLLKIDSKKILSSVDVPSSTGGSTTILIERESDGLEVFNSSVALSIGDNNITVNTLLEAGNYRIKALSSGNLFFASYSGYPIEDGDVSILYGLSASNSPVTSFYYFFKSIYFTDVAIFGSNSYLVDIPQKTGLYQQFKAKPNIKYSTNYKGVELVGYLKQVSLNPIDRKTITVELIESA